MAWRLLFGGRYMVVIFVVEEVVIYHTDPNEARPHLVTELEKNGIKTHSPINGESYNIG